MNTGRPATRPRSYAINHLGLSMNVTATAKARALVCYLPRRAADERGIANQVTIREKGSWTEEERARG